MCSWDLQVIFCCNTIEPGLTDTYTIQHVTVFAYSSFYAEEFICYVNFFLITNKPEQIKMFFPVKHSE